MSLLPAIEQSLMFARSLIGAQNGVAAPTRREFGGENGRKKFQKVPASEWRRLLSEALPRVGLMLRATHGSVVDGSLMSTFRLTYVGAGLGFGAVDEWTVATPMGPAPSRDLAAQWARTKAVSGVARDLLWQWDESDEAQEEPEEQPKAERTTSRNGTAPDRNERGAAPARPSRKVAAAGAALAHVQMAGAPIAVELGDEEREQEAREHAEAERLRAMPSSVPPVPDAPGLMDDEPNTADKGATIPAPKPATQDVPAAGAEACTVSAPVLPSTDGTAPLPPLAVPSAPPAEESAQAPSAGGGLLTGRVDPEGRRLGTALKKIRERIEANGETDEDTGGSGNLRDSLRLLRNLPGPTEAERHAKANEKARASRAFARVAAWPDEQREKWLEDSKSADDAAYRKRLVMLARGQTPGECVDIACGEHPTGEEHNAALQALIDEDDAEPLAEPSPEQVSLVGAVAERACAGPVCEAGKADGVACAPEECDRESGVRPAPSVAGPADLRGAKRAERLRSMGERPVLRELVKRGGGSCAACPTKFVKGDEVEIRGGKRRHVQCPKAVTA